MTDEESKQYIFMKGVEMKPGVHVYCDDRDEMVWDEEGTIIETRGAGGGWQYLVRFANNHDVLLWENQIWPTDEEQQSESAEPGGPRGSLKVFLCHAHEDKAVVRELYERLRKAGMRPWLDEEDIAPGEEWDQAIRRAVHECQIVLVLLSPKSLDKAGYVQKEIRFALDRADEMPEGRTYIIPVKLQECAVPSRLSKWQWVSLYTPDGHNRLIAAFRKHAVALQGHSAPGT